MKSIILKFSFILLLGLLVEWWLTQFSPLNLPANIPHTSIRISGLLLMALLISVLIIFQKTILQLQSEKTIFQLTMTGGLVCLIAEFFFQLIRQTTLDADKFSDRVFTFSRGTIGITIFGIIISFLVSFQLKTKKTGQLVLLIIGVIVLSNIILYLIG